MAKSFFLLIILLALIPERSGAETPTVACSEAQIESPKYAEAMRRLAQKLPSKDEFLDRHQEEIVSSLCENPVNTESINQSIDSGYVDKSTAEILAKELGKSYKASKRTAQGKRYEVINKALIDQGLCQACASEIAAQTIKVPKGMIAELSNNAVYGDEKSKEILNKITPLSDGEKIIDEIYAMSRQDSEDSGFIDSTPLGQCMVENILRGIGQRETFIECSADIVTVCNTKGYKTKAHGISSVTDELQIDNAQCARLAGASYRGTAFGIEQEFQIYKIAEGRGLEYKPTFFNIKAYAK